MLLSEPRRLWEQKSGASSDASRALFLVTRHDARLFDGVCLGNVGALRREIVLLLRDYLLCLLQGIGLRHRLRRVRRRGFFVARPVIGHAGSLRPLCDPGSWPLLDLDAYDLTDVVDVPDRTLVSASPTPPWRTALPISSGAVRTSSAVPCPTIALNHPSR